jgi:hypothetical protein
MEAIQFLIGHSESEQMVLTSLERYPIFTDIETVFVIASDFAKLYNGGKL